jgi:hypothetical protein
MLLSGNVYRSQPPKYLARQVGQKRVERGKKERRRLIGFPVLARRQDGRRLGETVGGQPRIVAVAHARGGLKAEAAPTQHDGARALRARVYSENQIKCRHVPASLSENLTGIG